MSIQVIKRPHYRCLTGNPVHYELFSENAYGDPSVYFEIRLKFKPISDTIFGDVVTLPYYPTHGTAQIDVREILDGLLKWAVAGLNGVETTIWDAATQSCYYYIEFREMTVGNTNPSWDTSEMEFVRWVMKGGLNDFKYQGNNFWINYFAGTKPFFTWQKSGRMAAYSERMYLHWLNADYNADPDKLFVEVKAYYTDGTNDNELKAFLNPYVNGLIYIIPAGAAQWDINSWNPSKTLWYWTVEVKKMINDDFDVPIFEALSEVFRYDLDIRNDDIAITLNYRNSLGGLDSVRIRGSLEKKVDYAFDEVENVADPDYFSGYYFQPQKKIINNMEQVVYSGNTGPLKKEELDRMRDLHLIREVWMVKGSKWIPINNITKGFNLIKNTDQLFSMPVDFTLGYPGAEYYTPDSVDLGTGEFTSNVCRAAVTPLKILVDVSGIDAALTFEGVEVDLENNSDDFRYRILNADGTVYADWVTKAWADLPFFSNIPKSIGVKTVEAQAICPNSVYGRKTTVLIDTDNGFSPGSGSSSITNNTSIGKNMQLMNQMTMGLFFDEFVGANNVVHFSMADSTYALLLTIGAGFSPSSAKIISNGVLYNGTINNNLVTWNGVAAVGGITILVY